MWSTYSSKGHEIEGVVSLSHGVGELLVLAGLSVVDGDGVLLLLLSLLSDHWTRGRVVVLGGGGGAISRLVDESRPRLNASAASLFQRSVQIAQQCRRVLFIFGGRVDFIIVVVVVDIARLALGHVASIPTVQFVVDSDGHGVV